MFDNQKPTTPSLGDRPTSAPKPVPPMKEAGAAEVPPPVNLPQTGQPKVLPKEGRTVPGTEDIFADTDEVSAGPHAPAAKKPAPPTVMPKVGDRDIPPPSGPPEPLSQLPDDLEEEGSSKKFFWLGLVVLIIILGAGGYYVYGKFFANGGIKLPEFTTPAEMNRNIQDDVVNLNLNRNVNQEEGEPEEVGGALNENVNQPAFIDSDHDGLTDEEEEALGTDPFESDSDNDGLFDREEVKVYETDPLNPDTDGDGYLDGDEIEAGYDPKGSGKLLDLNFEE